MNANTPTGRGRGRGNTKRAGAGRRAELNRLYACPLPWAIDAVVSDLRPSDGGAAPASTVIAAVEASGASTTNKTQRTCASSLSNRGALATSFLGIFGFFSSSAEPRIRKPHIEGVLDWASKSVWVFSDSANKGTLQERVGEDGNTNQYGDGDAMMLLWRRGFFGKGSLSRSEPSWRTRKVAERETRAASSNAGGQVPSATAEELTSKRRVERKQFKLDRARAIALAAAEAEKAFAERGVVMQESDFVIPSAATWKPTTTNVNTDDAITETTKGARGMEQESEEAELPAVDLMVQKDELEDLEEDISSAEHLQLTLQEAFFLAWAMDCLSIIDASSDRALNLLQTWRAFQNINDPRLMIPSPSSSADTGLFDTLPTRFDNPFLVSYVVYHHYRSLGWVVRSGIKFCVDYMLYKRGPVFSHAEFAVVVCPVYEDPSDRVLSPYKLQNVDPFSWTWLSTVNRVNAQVQKTLVIAYVMIPALCRVPKHTLQSPGVFSHYTIREVVVRRFIPARMRD